MRVGGSALVKAGAFRANGAIKSLQPSDETVSLDDRMAGVRFPYKIGGGFIYQGLKHSLCTGWFTTPPPAIKINAHGVAARWAGNDLDTDQFRLYAEIY